MTQEVADVRNIVSQFSYPVGIAAPKRSARYDYSRFLKTMADFRIDGPSPAKPAPAALAQYKKIFVEQIRSRTGYEPLEGIGDYSTPHL